GACRPSSVEQSSPEPPPLLRRDAAPTPPLAAHVFQESWLGGTSQDETTGSDRVGVGYAAQSENHVARRYKRRSRSMRKVTYVGLDVHAETIAVAVADPGGEVRSLGTIPNSPEAVGRLVRKLGAADMLRVCYEAGPCGYVLYWQLTKLGVQC